MEDFLVALLLVVLFCFESEVSDERTMREDLVIREGSPLEGRKGKRKLIRNFYYSTILLILKMVQILRTNYILQKCHMIKLIYIKQHHTLVDHQFFFNH